MEESLAVLVARIDERTARIPELERKVDAALAWQNKREGAEETHEQHETKQQAVSLTRATLWAGGVAILCSLTINGIAAAAEFLHIKASAP